MSKSLLEQLPEIVKEGRRAAEKILESIESKNKITLQTRTVLISNKDVAQASFFGRADAQQAIILNSKIQFYTSTRHLLKLTSIIQVGAAK